ncbi:MAG: aminotransferase class I/II-fold pyridoxal phosphate-dependent enzyme, partial [Candidatus Daviesbacteria bacterium]|nr:aminotransferase class I/II-fold pyridoxal phosphate-dependent enzyme [Candidatus Daviesbacteria bacterium]
MLSNPHLKKVIEMGSKIREMFEMALKFKAEGKVPIDFSLGSPDIKPPQIYYTALKEIILKSEKSARNVHTYMPNAGYPKTKSKVASDLSKKLKVPLKKEDIYMTAGSSNAIDIVLETLLEPATEPRFEKEEVICIAPYFVEYPHYIMNNQGSLIVADSDKNFNLNLKSIEKVITKKTKAIIINSPNNPTGAVYSKKSLSDLADLLENKNKKFNKEIAVIEDAAYVQLVFGKKRFNSIFPHYKHSFYTSSFSKSLGLAGERIGYLAVNPKIGENYEDRKIILAALTINLRTRIINAPAIQQKVIQKIGCNVKGKIRKYEKRVKELSKILREKGFKFQDPKGGFYLFPEIPDVFTDVNDFM